MSPSLTVLLNGRAMGEVKQDSIGKLRFEYREAWRRAPGATPLSLSMPLAGRSFTHGVVEAFLWGLLPDNDKVLDRWGRDYQVSPRNPFALLGHVGEECAGAAQFVRPERVEEVAVGGEVHWLDVDEVAERIRLLRRDQTAWQTSLQHGQFSLAGAQAKMALLRRDGRWGVPSGRIPTSHIIKPAIEGLDDHDLNEHLCLQAARGAGLRAARSEVVSFGSERAIVIERYDRVHNGDELARVHQEDLCQALGLPPTKKYQNGGGPTPKQIVEFLRAADPNASADAVAAFVDALAFNWLIGGTDAHAKNYSILLSGRQVRLAPLYDVASILPYSSADVRKKKLAMSIGGEYHLDSIFRRHWLRMAKALRLDGEATVARVVSLAEQVPECFARAGADERVQGLDTDLPERLAENVAARASSCLALLRAA